MDETALDRIKALQPELAAIWRDIYAYSQMGIEEVWTSVLVAETLRAEWR